MTNFSIESLKPDPKCKVYINCRNAKKLKNKLKEFNKNKEINNIRKILRLKRYLDHIVKFLDVEAKQEYNSYYAGTEKILASYLNFDLKSLIKFWLTNIKFLFAICIDIPIDKIIATPINEIIATPINEIIATPGKTIKNISTIDEINKNIIGNINIIKIKEKKAQNNFVFKSLKDLIDTNLDTFIITHNFDEINKYTLNMNIYIAILNEYINQTTIVISEDLKKTEEYNTPIFDDFMDHSIGGDMIEVSVKKTIVKDKSFNNKGCITQFTLKPMQFIVISYTNILKKLNIKEFDFTANLCIKSDKEYTKCTTNIDTDEIEMNLFYQNLLINIGHKDDPLCKIYIDKENLNKLKSLNLDNLKSKINIDKGLKILDKLKNLKLETLSLSYKLEELNSYILKSKKIIYMNNLILDDILNDFKILKDLDIYKSFNSTIIDELKINNLRTLTNLNSINNDILTKKQNNTSYIIGYIKKNGIDEFEKLNISVSFLLKDLINLADTYIAPQLNNKSKSEIDIYKGFNISDKNIEIHRKINTTTFYGKITDINPIKHTFKISYDKSMDVKINTLQKFFKYNKLTKSITGVQFHFDSLCPDTNNADNYNVDNHDVSNNNVSNNNAYIKLENMLYENQNNELKKIIRSNEMNAHYIKFIPIHIIIIIIVLFHAYVFPILLPSVIVAIIVGAISVPIFSVIHNNLKKRQKSSFDTIIGDIYI